MWLGKSPVTLTYSLLPMHVMLSLWARGLGWKEALDRDIG